MCKAVRSSNLDSAIVLVHAAIISLVLVTSVSIMSAQTTSANAAAAPQTTTQSSPPTVAEAEEFMRNAEVRLNDLTVKASRASWVQSNFITDDTEILSAEANEALIGATTELAKQATRYDHLQLSDELSRKMLLLKLSAAVPAPAPSDPKELAELARIGTSLEADYGKGQYCPKTGKHAGQCLDIGEIQKIMATSTDPAELEDLWAGWRTVASADARSATRAGSNWATKARERWASAIWARCGARATT